MDGKDADDERVLAALSSAQRCVELHERLGECMRNGFVELSSAKFSRGLSSGGARELSPATYPQYVEDCDDPQQLCVEPKAALSVQLDVEATLLEATVGDLATAVRGMQLCDSRDPAQGDDRDDKNGLRQRKKASGKEKDKTSEKKVEDHVQRWLGIQPRGPLEKSQRAFEQAVAVAVELAALTLRIQQENATHSMGDCK